MRLLNRLRLNYYSQRGFTPEAKAFIAAAGITDGAQKRAVDYLVKQLKANNLYTKFSALYPFVGGSADTHKFNLINPADSDAAFRIVWAGSVTHDGNGIKSNGTNGYGDTKYNPVTASASLTSFSLGMYKTGTEAGGGSKLWMGLTDGTNVSFLGWVISGSKEAGKIAATDASAQNVPSEANATQVQGNLSINVNGNRNAQLWSNGNKTGSAVTQTSGYANLALFLLSFNVTGSASSYSSETIIKLAYVSTGLSDSEMATLHTIVTVYQTMLGRN